MSAGSAVVRFFVLVFAVSLMCFPACALDEGMYVGNIELDIYPVDYEIVPDYNDGVVGTPIEGFLNFVYWDRILPIHLGTYLDFFKNTPLGDFTRTVLIPTFTTIIGFCFFVFFSRKSPDYLSPTAAKILSFLEGHPVSAEPAIIRGVGKSRGAVSYQLHRLLFDGKIYSAEISGKTCYSMSPILIDSPETAVYFMRNNKQQAEIISYLCAHPWATRKEIADAVSLPVDGVRYHLKNIDVGILQKGIREDAEIYAVEDWVKQLWEI